MGKVTTDLPSGGKPNMARVGWENRKIPSTVHGGLYSLLGKSSK